MTTLSCNEILQGEAIQLSSQLRALGFLFRNATQGEGVGGGEQAFPGVALILEKLAMRSEIIAEALDHARREFHQEPVPVNRRQNGGDDLLSLKAWMEKRT